MPDNHSLIILHNRFLVLFENYKSRSILDLKQQSHNKTKSKYQIGLRLDNREVQRSTCGTHFAKRVGKAPCWRGQLVSSLRAGCT